ncbi:hypothetical protein K438DRAFT_1763331 [Mycena galopus ATCC 62051]|nr:hypothetical protein K438DRAFT_1763331 [Mycena galopus ATCC 62051]
MYCIDKQAQSTFGDVVDSLANKSLGHFALLYALQLYDLPPGKGVTSADRGMVRMSDVFEAFVGALADSQIPPYAAERLTPAGEADALDWVNRLVEPWVAKLCARKSVVSRARTNEVQSQYTQRLDSLNFIPPVDLRSKIDKARAPETGEDNLAEATKARVAVRAADKTEGREVRRSETARSTAQSSTVGLAGLRGSEY